jgi:RNA polymerase sigma-B factor
MIPTATTVASAPDLELIAVDSDPASTDVDPDLPTALIDAMAALPATDRSRPALRDRAIVAWLPMAKRLASRYAGRGEPLDDLVQVATIGLVKAVDRFDPQRGVSFGSYAIPTIVGEIKRHFRDRTWWVRVPRRLQELRLAIGEANSTLSHRLRRAPTVADIATHLGVGEDEVVEGLEAAHAYSATSLSRPAGPDGQMELGDTLGEDDRDLEVAELRVALGPAIATLDPRERRILMLRFYGNCTQTQIAEQIGVSQMHVSRLLSRALMKLRGQLDPEGL